VPQLKMSKDKEQDSTPYVPKTDEERNEAVGLLDELLKELGQGRSTPERAGEVVFGPNSSSEPRPREVTQWKTRGSQGSRRQPT
jgi:hypothetical protein